MKPFRNSFLALIATVLLACAVYAQEPEPDPFSHLPDLEMVMANRLELELSEEQLKRVASCFDELRRQVPDLQDQVQRARRELNRLFQTEPVDEEQVMATLDRMLDAELKIKRLHLRSLIRAQNTLTAEQREKISQLKADARHLPGNQSPINDVQKRLHSKMGQIQEELEKRHKADDPLLKEGKLLRRFHGELKLGRVKAAEDILDRLMERLELEWEEDSPQPELPNTFNDKSVSDLPRQSIQQVRGAVAALKKEDVAWRKIDWEICLLEGLQRSKNENKPVLLWVFIDRPIDDERC